MLSLELSVADLAQTRFAISPMNEVIAGLRLLHEPERAGPHSPWMRDALRAAEEIDITGLLALTPPSGYLPDLLTPPPEAPLAAFGDELERVRATPPEVVEREIRSVFHGKAMPASARALISEPRTELERLATVLERWWHRVVEPHWSRIRATLDAEVAHRARRLTSGGPAALFRDLHPLVRWHGDRLTVATGFDADVALDGRGLVLMPSAFYWRSVGPIIAPPWQPTLIYPARGVELLWRPGEATPHALAGVVGRSRAALLAALDAPRSTTDLARRLRLSPGAVSQHLAALRAVGLLTATRHGREVLYLRTPLADRLMAAG